MQTHDGLKRDLSRVSAFAHDLAMHLALRWHINDHIAAEFCLTAQATMRAERATLIGVTLFDLIPFCQMIFG